MNFTLKKSDLNFKVYIVAAKPTTPGAENDIAVISSVPMTNWLMSPEAPSGTPRNDGDVWIQYSVSGNTKNILKQNALMIATINAWQYVDGVWVDREAVSCQGGVWVDWITDLVIFAAGKGAVVECATKYATADTITVTNTKITVDGDDVVFYTKNKINTSGYKTLRLTGKFTEINSDADLTGFGLMSSVPVADNFSAQTGWVSSKEISSASSTSKTYDCPISGSGSYYVVFAGAHCAGEITDIRLIP